MLRRPLVHYLRYLPGLFLGIALCLLEAQAVPLRTLNFEYLDVKDGLVQETVTAIVQDHRGFMWFGSQHGLSRFDGYKFVVFKTVPDDPRSLADNWVQTLYVDEQDRLWVGSRGGLQRFDPATNNFTRFLPDGADESSSAKRYVQSIIGDGHGQLWLATNDGLQHFDPASGRFAILRHDPQDPASLSDNRINALARDVEGNLWLGMRGCMDRLAPGASSFRHFRMDGLKNSTAAYKEVEQLWVDQKNKLWIATPEGLVTWQLGGEVVEAHRFGPEDGLQPGLITAFLQDREGNVWLGTNTMGLQRWDAQSKRFIVYPADPRSMAGNEVSALFQDRSGTLWVGTWTAGVKRVDLASGGFNRFYHVAGNPKTLSDNRIYGMSEDGHGRLLLATFGGIDRLDPANGEIVNLHPDPGMRSRLNNEDIVLALYRDRNGTTWAGTSAGLSRFDPDTGRFVSKPYHLSDPNTNSVTHINSDRDGTMWVSTRGGLRRLDPVSGQGNIFLHDAAQSGSLSDDWVKMTLEDRDGALWVATDDGLNRFDRTSGKFTQFHHNSKDFSSLSSDRVQYLFQDSRGTLWVGTNAGLNKIEIGEDKIIRFRNYTTRDGLPNDSIGGILEADDGDLWLSTATGISRFSPRSSSFRNYTARDGMIEGFYFSGSAFRAKDGTMYFGGANGLTAFRPENIRDNPYPPEVVITDFQASGASLPGWLAASSSKPGLTLSYDQSAIAIEFSALHYADPQRNRYRYQLQGLDKTWVDADSSKRLASYTNLEPGNYVFRVKASNNDGIWNEAGATLAITITPPFWKTWWFRIGGALAVLGALWMLDRARVRIHLDQKARLEALVTTRTSEVLQQKSIIERKNAELETAHFNLQSLSDIGRNITATLDRNQIVLNIHEHVASLMPLDFFCIWQRREEDEGHADNMSFIVENSVPPRVTDVTDDEQGAESSLADWCVSQGREIFIGDVEAEGREDFVPAAQQIRTRSLLAAPIFVNDEIIGVISVQSMERHAYLRIHLEMLLGIAAYAGVALDNANAYSQLQIAQRQLQNYLEDRERLFMSISHDLRSPITRLILRSEFLEDDELREEFHDDLDDLDMMVKSALQSVKDTEIHENFTEVRLDSMIGRMLRGAELAGHKIAYAESGVMVSAKPLALKRAIGNLLDNALMYGKDVEVQVKEYAEEHAAHVDILIRDHGPGVPEGALRSLANSYVRLDHGRKQNANGLGLGLSIARGIADAHGGTLLLENHPQGGLQAIIRLPVT